jgi:hypothetical protein
MKEYPMIAIEEEEHYLSDKHKAYKSGWNDSKFDKPPKKIQDATKRELYLIGYSDYIANLEMVWDD